MNHSEMRNEFNVLYNNIMSNQAPGLNDYEISVFLTKSQNEILKNYFNPKGNKYQEGMDDSPKRQIDFSNLINAVALSEIQTPAGYAKRDPRSKLYSVPTGQQDGFTPEKMMFILNEYALKTAGSEDMENYILVRPISYTEYQRLMSKPYKWPVHGEAWRLLQTTESQVEIAEIVCKETIAENSYYMVYVRKPKPIIVGNLGQTSGVTIDGYYNAMDCELDSILHEEIVQRAVELAKAAYVGDVNSMIQTGQRSE